MKFKVNQVQTLLNLRPIIQNVDYGKNEKDRLNFDLKVKKNLIKYAFTTHIRHTLKPISFLKSQFKLS